MFEQQPEALQQKIKQLAAASDADPSAWFETVYAQSQGDTSEVPWAKLRPHPSLVDWLSCDKIQGEGKLALVIGCGLGDDAEAVASRGFQVTAFDISPTAIAWCERRFPNSTVTYQVADLFDLDRQWHGKYDFIFESHTIQALPLKVRSKTISAIAPLVAPNGTLLVVTRLRDTDAEPEGPPWALSDRELAGFETLGLSELERERFDRSDTVTEVRIEYHRPADAISG
ncbi:MAG: class I SAM-dependent methyltransferase [Cyanobacteriota bacterium]|nr:class I SAM-dependent methyltransferase [Cyanobacteriota bacterium]